MKRIIILGYRLLPSGFYLVHFFSSSKAVVGSVAYTSFLSADAAQPIVGAFSSAKGDCYAFEGSYWFNKNFCNLKLGDFIEPVFICSADQQRSGLDK